MKIFLIAGKSRSGKTSVAKRIKKYYNQKGEKTLITEFTKYLKLYAYEMLSWDGNEPKPRKFLQEMGTLIRVKMNKPDFFIKRMKEDIEIYSRFYDNIIISDVRLPKEITTMKECYQNVFSIHVIGNTQNYDLNKKEQAHETEHALDKYQDFDFTVINDNFNNLETKINQMLGDCK